PAWSKIVALRRVLPNYDWVFWCDTDAVLWRPDVGLRQFVACADSAVILQANHEAPNSGLFFIRNCPWSFHFLDEVYRQEQFIHHPCWENMAIIELLNKEEIRSRVHVYPKQQLPGGFHGFRYYNDWDKIFIHHPGMGDSRYRLWLIDNLVRLAEMDDRNRVLVRADLGALLNRLGLLGEGVEVGVEAGEFAATVLNSWEGRRLHLVDAWRHLPDYDDVCNIDDAGHEARLRQLPERLSRHAGRYQIHRMLSREATAAFENGSLDFAYIDAQQTYEAVREDLSLWYPKVRTGGVFAGHDFLDSRPPDFHFGVRRAVLEFERQRGVRAAVTTECDWPSWYLIKP
ncbi:MAG TPA: class I SAM-dependent methyltransferase, partial [Pirellulales bacterium]